MFKIFLGETNHGNPDNPVKIMVQTIPGSDHKRSLTYWFTRLIVISNLTPAPSPIWRGEKGERNEAFFDN